jgi:hypothetical protein
MEQVRTALTLGAAVFGLLAAVLWAIASFRKIPPHEDDPSAPMEQRQGFQMTSIAKDGKQTDILATAESQTFWNGWAALSAAIAAVCQVALLRFP